MMNTIMFSVSPEVLYLGRGGRQEPPADARGERRVLGAASFQDLLTEVTLKTGTRVRVRPVRVEDELGLVAFYDALSPETLVRRFFGGKQRVRREWIRALAKDVIPRSFGPGA